MSGKILNRVHSLDKVHPVELINMFYRGEIFSSAFLREKLAMHAAKAETEEHFESVRQALKLVPKMAWLPAQREILTQKGFL